ncbi:MAG: hypothetical protein ACQCN6_05425 [Candidatus Bathyarchaeia archaeon]
MNTTGIPRPMDDHFDSQQGLHTCFVFLAHSAKNNLIGVFSSNPSADLIPELIQIPALCFSSLSHIKKAMNTVFTEVAYVFIVKNMQQMLLALKPAKWYPFSLAHILELARLTVNMFDYKDSIKTSVFAKTGEIAELHIFKFKVVSIFLLFWHHRF